MFDFFDNQKNPLMFMMNMMNAESMGEQTIPEQALDPELVEMMKEAFGMHMQMMRMMCTMPMQFAGSMLMMPMQMIKPMAEMMAGKMSGAAEAGSKAPASGAFKIGNFDVSPEMLQKLMAIDMSPENLDKLQKVLDFVFGMMPDKKEEQDA